MNWVYAAYGVTWLVHICYIVILFRGYKALKKELDQDH